MSNPSDWNSEHDHDDDDMEDEVEGAFEREHEDEDEDEEPGEEEDEEGGSRDAAAVGGCLRTMILAVAFWMVVALAALGFCVVFGGGW